MHRIDSDGSIDGAWSNGNPPIGQLGTKLDDDWQNAVQEELAYFIEHLGGTLVKGTNTQLLTTLLTKSWALAGSALQSILKGGTGGLDIGTSIASDLRVLLNNVAQWTFRASDGALVSAGGKIATIGTPTDPTDAMRYGDSFAAPTLVHPSMSHAGWTNGASSGDLGDVRVAYFKDRCRVVHLHGQATYASGDDRIFTFPAGYVPSGTRVMPRENGSSTKYLQVDQTGQVRLVNATADTYFLDGFSFLAEA
jgi:hypothetical protein